MAWLMLFLGWRACPPCRLTSTESLCGNPSPHASAAFVLHAKQTLPGPLPGPRRGDAVMGKGRTAEGGNVSIPEAPVQSGINARPRHGQVRVYVVNCSCEKFKRPRVEGSGKGQMNDKLDQYITEGVQIGHLKRPVLEEPLPLVYGFDNLVVTLQ